MAGGRHPERQALDPHGHRVTSSPPHTFVAPLIVSDLLCQAHLALTTRAPSRALSFVDQARDKLTVAAEAHARVLGS